MTEALYSEGHAAGIRYTFKLLQDAISEPNIKTLISKILEQIDKQDEENNSRVDEVLEELDDRKN
jgi:hypothetical protein